MILTPTQVLVIVGMVTIGTMITRFLLLFYLKVPTRIIHTLVILGQVLPYAAIGLLIVYCLKNVSFRNPAYWVPEAIAIICIIVLHNWRG
jgi:branched-subunit amino acid transport protein AzlD